MACPAAAPAAGAGRDGGPPGGRAVDRPGPANAGADLRRRRGGADRVVDAAGRRQRGGAVPRAGPWRAAARTRHDPAGGLPGRDHGQCAVRAGAPDPWGTHPRQAGACRRHRRHRADVRCGPAAVRLDLGRRGIARAGRQRSVRGRVVGWLLRLLNRPWPARVGGGHGHPACPVVRGGTDRGVPPRPRAGRPGGCTVSRARPGQPPLMVPLPNRNRTSHHRSVQDLTNAQVAGLFQVTEQTVHDWASHHKLPHQWVHGRRYPTAAHVILNVAPQARQGARENRAFLQRAVRFLAQEAGIRQFLDIGTGLPTQGNVHQVAQQVAPDARVAYVDHDPVVHVHANALLANHTTTIAVLADLRQPQAILDHSDVRGLLDLARPVAVLLVAVLHFITEAEDPAGIVAWLREAMAPGSYLVISHATGDFHPHV